MRHRVDKRMRALAELKAATLTQCEFCIDMGSQTDDDRRAPGPSY
jgi:AhpD family alkylhydroperoxidase